MLHTGGFYQGSCHLLVSLSSCAVEYQCLLLLWEYLLQHCNLQINYIQKQSSISKYENTFSFAKPYHASETANTERFHMLGSVRFCIQICELNFLPLTGARSTQKNPQRAELLQKAVKYIKRDTGNTVTAQNLNFYKNLAKSLNMKYLRSLFMRLNSFSLTRVFQDSTLKNEP